jgi:hypothetical protein
VHKVEVKQLTKDFENGGSGHGPALSDVSFSINTNEFISMECSVAELRAGPRSDYLEGFVSPAFQLSRAVPESELCCDTRWLDIRDCTGKDWY